MGDNELTNAAAVLVQGAGFSEETSKLITSAGGVVFQESGRLVLQAAVHSAWNRLSERFKESKKADTIRDDFEKTDHGAALLQEALRALSQGLDEERAKAVQDVFLGLAQTPAEDSLGRLQQIDILKIASELTTWELFYLNAIERYSKEVFNPEMQNIWDEKSPGGMPAFLEEYPGLEQEVVSNLLTDWFRKNIGFDEQLNQSVQDASKSLCDKMVLRFNFHEQNNARFCIVDRWGAFTTFGQKLAVHLYSATDEAEN